jgi:DNA-binding transcriptional MocR family regulator
MQDIELSEYGSASAEPSPVSRMMAAFANDFRDDIDINLGVGYVNEQTLPKAQIARAVQEVVDHPDAYVKPLNYGDPRGTANLIGAIRKFEIDYCGQSEAVLDRNEIIVGPNGATSLLEAIAHVLPRGIVIMPDPVYYIYANTLERMGFKIVAVPEDTEGIRVDLLKEKLDELGPRKGEIRFIYVITVNNPSSTILSNQRAGQLVSMTESLCKELDRKIPLVFDKAYERLIHDPAVKPRYNALANDKLGRVYEVSTLSKILAPGLRIGYLIGPAGPFVRALVQKSCDVGFSAPPLNQEIAGYLLKHEITAQLDTVNAGYRQKALKVKEWIDDCFGPVMEECRGGQAGFYYYLTLKEIPTHPESPFFKFLTRTTGDAAIDGPMDDRKPRVIYIPGIHCVHAGGDLTEKGKRQLRISYGFEEIERIGNAFKLLAQALDYAG